MNSSTKDITDIIEGWEYDTYNPRYNFRKIKGLDGKEKIQQRNLLGLVQYETTGRPDGARPFNRKSLLHYLQHLEKTNLSKILNFLPNNIIPNITTNILSEYGQYMARSYAFFMLEDYKRSSQDSYHNLQLINLLKRHPLLSQEILGFIKFGYSATSFNYHRALLHYNLERKFFDEAIVEVRKCISFIKSNEEILSNLDFALENLIELEEYILSKNLPITKKGKLEKQLKQAIEDEDYKKAAEIRDELKKIL